MEGRKVPGIRFEGFEEEWEQRKLGEILYSLRNNTLSRAELSLENGVVKNVHYGDILVKFGEILDVKKELLPMIVDELVLAKYRDSFLQNGDIVIADTAEDETVGKCIEIAGVSNEKIIAGLHTIPCRPLFNFASGYLGYYLNSDDYHRQLLPLMQGIKVTSISKSALQDTIIQYPKSLEEQVQIGTYFRWLDHLITLHQRRYKRLKLFKESMLNKMFPKDSEKIPEIRFEGFSNDWKQHKLGKIASKITMKNTGSQYIETFTNSAEFGIISQRDFFDHNVSNIENIEGYYVVEDDVFVYNPRISTSAPVGPINRNKLGRTGVVSPLYTVFKTHDIDSEYLEWYFKSNHWHLFMYFNGDTGARSDRFSIKDSVFFEMPIPIPDIDEQIKIGKYLSKLDSLITLQQYKLENLQNFKKSLLEKMFT